MSVLIKGMEMPTTCHVCRLYEGDIYYCSPAGRTIDIPDSSEGRCSFCPLVPVPPHGDLIDAQEQMRLMQSCDYDTYDDYNRAFDMLDYAPTIIPADPTEES